MVRFTQQAALRFPHSDPDVRLMLRVRNGDIEAFETLWTKYHNRVRFVIDHLMGHQQQTEDLAQDVFLRLYRARAKYVPTAKFSTWLFTIVNNVVSNARRSYATRREVNLHAPRDHGNLLVELKQEPGRNWPAQQLERSELRDIVRLAIDELNDRQRTAVRLRSIEGMSHAEIALEMGTSPDAIKSLLHRARANLHDMLEPYLEDGNQLNSNQRAAELAS